MFAGTIASVPVRGRPKDPSRVKATFRINKVLLKKIDGRAAAEKSSRGKVVEAEFQSK